MWILPQVIQPQSSILDWPSFQHAFDLASHNLGAMSSQNQVLAFVIQVRPPRETLRFSLIAWQAWAARFSDHPYIIGSEGPSLAELRSDALGRDFSEVGEARDGFAKLMTARAIKHLDEKGALRKVGSQSCGALLMIELLVGCELVRAGSLLQLLTSTVARGASYRALQATHHRGSHREPPSPLRRRSSRKLRRTSS